MRALVAVALAVSIALGGADAAAQGATEQAKVLFNAGAQAYEAGRYAAAIQAFEEAYRLSPRPGILFSIAQAYRRQYTTDKQPAHLRAAIKHYREYVAKVEQGGRRSDAVQALSELEPIAERLGAVADPGAPAPERKTATQLMVSAQTKGAMIALDGGKPAEAPLIAEVKPGKHKIVVEAPGYFPEERELQAAAGGVVALDIVMRDRPGTLAIRSRDGADVSIDGRLSATTPLAQPLELAPGHHSVAVTKRGYKPFSEEIELGRGEARQIDARIEVTGQRIGAYALIGVGAAAAVGGGVLAGLAWFEQRDAQTIDTQRTTKGNLAEAKLTAYKDHLAARDDLRRWAGVALVGAAAVGVTATLLAVFDVPTVTSYRRDSHGPAPTTPREHPMELSAAPIVAPGLYGATIAVSF